MSGVSKIEISETSRQLLILDKAASLRKTFGTFYLGPNP